MVDSWVVNLVEWWVGQLGILRVGMKVKHSANEKAVVKEMKSVEMMALNWVAESVER
jgi:hypothetical protein